MTNVFTINDAPALKAGDALPVGNYRNIPDSIYHADTTAVSSSQIRTLAKEGGEARYHYEATHEKTQAEPNPAFEFGHLAHALLLPNNAAAEQIEIIEAENFRSKAARDLRDEATAAGRYPMLAKDAQVFEDMSAALRSYTSAMTLFALPGESEISIITTTPSGIRVKARPDFLPDAEYSGGVFVDYKTTNDASWRAFERAASTSRGWGYCQQAAWYIDTLRAAGWHENPRMIFLVQEKTPPYLTAAYELGNAAIDYGRRRNQQGLTALENALNSDRWPGFTSCIKTVDPYIFDKYEDESEN